MKPNAAPQAPACLQACLHGASPGDQDAVGIGRPSHDDGVLGVRDDGVQAVLPVAHAAIGIELDGFARQPPLAALDGGSHGLNPAAGDLAIGAATVEPFLGQLGGDGHDLQFERRLAPR